MRKVWLFAALTLLCIRLSAQPQVLFTENFETGGAAFTINTTDVSSQTDATGYNKWIVNNVYVGGNGSITCLGFPIGYTIAPTPPQPAGITNFPNSFYMHLLSDEAQLDGINCASYLAADGFCNFAQNHFTRMTSDVTTTGLINVNISFWWLCAGSPNGFGELYYSTDGGSSWILTTTPSQYFAQASWTQTTVTNPAFNNQATLRFGYRFVNNQTNAAADPSFSIDDVVITGTIPSTITTGTVAPTTYCPGDPIAVPYTITGVFNAGNNFNLELSDAAGNFAGAPIIGTLAATIAGTVNGTIPVATPAGTGYRVRIVSDNPAITGSDNGVDLTVNAIPVGGTATPQADTVCSGSSTTIDLTGYTGNIQWQESLNGTLFNDLVGQTSPSVNTGPLGAVRYYRAIVSTTCGTDTSSVAQVNIATPPVGGTLSIVPDSICAGESVSLDLIGSSGSGEIWSSTDGIIYSLYAVGTPPIVTSPLTVSTFFIVITSNAWCPDDTSNVVFVTVNPTPSPSITPASPEFCEGQSVLLDAGAGYTSYVWTDASITQQTSITGAGIHGVTVTDANGCTGMDQVTVTMNPNPVAAFTSSTNLLVANFTDASTGSPTTWSWNFGDGNTSIIQNPSNTYATPGTYTVTLIVTNSFGCSDTTSSQVTVSNVGINSHLHSTFLESVYPNPFSQYITINFDLDKSQMVCFTLKDISGREIMLWECGEQGAGSHSIEFRTPQNLAEGMYFLSVKFGEEEIITKLNHEKF